MYYVLYNRKLAGKDTFKLQYFLLICMYLLGRAALTKYQRLS